MAPKSGPIGTPCKEINNEPFLDPVLGPLFWALFGPPKKANLDAQITESLGLFQWHGGWLIRGLVEATTNKQQQTTITKQ